ncbi:MAG: hypothetical protein ABR553_08925 [Gammaproteobacteria bacterium]
MDIARLSSLGHSSPYPSASRGPADRARVLERLTETAAAASVRGPVERVVQGELLQRRNAVYGPTQAFLSNRVFDAAEVGAEYRAHANPGHASRALGAYLGHTREFIQPDVNRGKQVDYFI